MDVEEQIIAELAYQVRHAMPLIIFVLVPAEFPHPPILIALL
jgi:hypothetical protein